MLKKKIILITLLMASYCMMCGFKSYKFSDSLVQQNFNISIIQHFIESHPLEIKDPCVPKFQNLSNIQLLSKEKITEFISNSKITEQISNENSIDPSTFFVKAESTSISLENLQLAESIWNQVPEHIRNFLKNNGWQVIISAQSLNNRFGYSSSIAGLTDFSNKIIYLDNRSSAIKSSLMHEIGHAIDTTYGQPSQSAEFINLYNLERGSFYEVDNVSDNHGTSSNLEYFAAIVNNIIKTGNTYYHTAPQSYDFVRRYM